MNLKSSTDFVFTRRLNEVILTNLENERFGVNELSRELGISRFSLNRKLHFICGKTINQYIREFRLHKAMELLQEDLETASEISYHVGFHSPAYFNTCFSEYYGYPPGEVKKRGLNGSGEIKEEDLGIQSKIKQNTYSRAKSFLMWRKKIRLSVGMILVSGLIISGLTYIFSNHIFRDLNFTSTKQIKSQQKSIAVLPFINDSHDPENVYFINGVMESILDHLSRIKDLEVHTRTSVEQYRNNKTKTIPQIARELGVNYIIEGSGQKIGDQVSLSIQLTEAGSDKHLLSKRYTMKLEDIFNLQSEVAIKVASEIRSIITLDEKELIKKHPTASVAAWEMYSRGMELHNIADLENNMTIDMQAKEYFKKAIQLDSTYAEPYVQLGWITSSMEGSDSAFYFADKALHFDDKNSNAHCFRGWLLSQKGHKEEAEDAFNLAIRYNPNCTFAYDFLADMYYNQGDSYKAIKNKLKALKLQGNSNEKRYNLISLWDSFNNVGLFEEGQKYAEKLIVLTGDSTYYYWSLLQSEYVLGNSQSVVNYAHKIYRTDSLNLGKLLGMHHSYFLGNTFLNLRDYKEAYRILQKYTESMLRQGRKVQPYHYFGYVYLQNGLTKEANFHFEGAIKYRLQLIEQNKPTEVSPPNLGLAYIYAARGEKEKALEHMRAVNRCAPFLYRCAHITGLKINPMVDCIRNEPEYIIFLKNAEIRYLEEHIKVEKLLRTEGILHSSL